jgi:[ribosomal protein S5]-alanine N-acetyltransferase
VRKKVTDDVAIETARLRLRLLAPQDAALYVALYTNADVMRHIAPPLSASEAMASFQFALKRTHTKPVKQLFFAIERQDTQATIGICGLMQFADNGTRAEVGMMLVPGTQGLKLGKEGLSALVKFVFSNFSVSELFVQYAGDSASSAGIARSVGFQEQLKSSTRQTTSLVREGTMTRKMWMQFTV